MSDGLWFRLNGYEPRYPDWFIEIPESSFRGSPCFGCGGPDDPARINNLFCGTCGLSSRECWCPVDPSLRAQWINVAWWRSRPIRDYMPGEERFEW